MLHYPIVSTTTGSRPGYGLSFHNEDLNSRSSSKTNKTFLTVSDLVDYYQFNRSRLAVRPRRPLSQARWPPSAILDATDRNRKLVELRRENLKLSSDGLRSGGADNCGLTCLGTYRCPETQQVLKVTADLNETETYSMAFMTANCHRTVSRLLLMKLVHCGETMRNRHYMVPNPLYMAFGSFLTFGGLFQVANKTKS